MKILTIDDQNDIRRLIRMTLEFDGHDTIEATSAVNGIELARSKKPDLILLDVLMPDMDGIEVCRLLKSDPITKKIPVIMLSGSDNVNIIESCTNNGAALYVKKPFNPIELLNLIQKFENP
jgi:CheY-like chemotaxis protein